VQPDAIIDAQQAQQDWIMAQQSLSPLVQVMQTPMSVASHLHMPIMRLQQQAIIPFIIMQQEHIPPAFMVQRFWSIPAATLSSQVQVIFIPPAHFSKVMVHRGTIIMFMPMPAGDVAGAPIMPAGPPMPMVAMPIPVRSVIIPVIWLSLPVVAPPDDGPSPAPPARLERILATSDREFKRCFCKSFTDHDDDLD
jgi:hypothetical protein